MASFQSNNTRRPVIISIEGNIGAGKTTLLHHLKSALQSHPKMKAAFMPEPVDLWNTVTDENGKTILEKYYDNPSKYAFPFQIMAFSTRLGMLQKTINENPDCDVIVCERSLEADREIFAKMLFEDNLIEFVNYQVYEMLFDQSAKDLGVDGVVYLNPNPDVCIERIHTRNRTGENKISLDYLRKCHNYYDTWLVSNEDKNKHSLMCLDTTPNVCYEDDEGNHWIRNVIEFVETQVLLNNVCSSLRSHVDM